MIDWYEPGEDTYTLIDSLVEESISENIVVDMGCSTGIITKLLEKNNIVISVDLNEKALNNFEGTGNLIRSNLFWGIKQSKIDVCVFNPPYVSDFECDILGGGKHGRHIIDRFIREVKIPVVYLLIIEANKPKEVLQLFKKHGYSADAIKIRKVIGETIIVIKALKQR